MAPITPRFVLCVLGTWKGFRDVEGLATESPSVQTTVSYRRGTKNEHDQGTL